MEVMGLPCCYNFRLLFWGKSRWILKPQHLNCRHEIILKVEHNLRFKSVGMVIPCRLVNCYSYSKICSAFVFVDVLGLNMKALTFFETSGCTYITTRCTRRFENLQESEIPRCSLTSLDEMRSNLRIKPLFLFTRCKCSIIEYFFSCRHS
jgi:hypothetical protein